eukprot:3064418-Pyramimonas_sp.AAC.1
MSVIVMRSSERQFWDIVRLRCLFERCFARRGSQVGELQRGSGYLPAMLGISGRRARGGRRRGQGE